MEKINVRNVLVKKPFRKIKPRGFYTPNIVRGDVTTDGYEDMNDTMYEIVPQSTFLREYFVSGHKINDPAWYPNKHRYDDSEAVKAINRGKGAWVEEKVARTAFAFQFIIKLKQVIHLTGNTIHFQSSNLSLNESNKELLSSWKQWWLDKNLEVAFFEAVDNEKMVGDVATCFYLQDGKMGWRTFSFANGDILYPHYDRVTGKLDLFARRYGIIAEDGTTKKEVVEVWDDKFAYVFEKDSSSKVSKFKNVLLDFFGLDGYKQIGEATHHNCSRIPIAYKRNDYGAAWSLVEENIEQYEMSVSQLCENNKAFAFPILTIVGDDVEIKGAADGRPYAITSPNSDTKIGKLGGNDSSSSFELQLNTLLKNIFMGSFVVTPPEVRSGDLPGAAIKLIYSPALEKAISDAKQWDFYMDNMVEIAKEGYGIENTKTAEIHALHIKGKIIPYIHENIAETINIIAQAVLAGVLSVETATSINPLSMSDEYKRTLTEKTQDAMLEGINNNHNQAQAIVAQNK